MRKRPVRGGSMHSGHGGAPRRLGAHLLLVVLVRNAPRVAAARILRVLVRALVNQLLRRLRVALPRGEVQRREAALRAARQRRSTRPRLRDARERGTTSGTRGGGGGHGAGSDATAARAGSSAGAAHERLGVHVDAVNVEKLVDKPLVTRFEREHERREALPVLLVDVGAIRDALFHLARHLVVEAHGCDEVGVHRVRQHLDVVHVAPVRDCDGLTLRIEREDVAAALVSRMLIQGL
eukprot:7145931-Prymnesium_polylepis.2